MGGGIAKLPVGAWVLGLVLGVISFSAESESPEQVRILASAGVLLIVSVALRMAAQDPIGWTAFGTAIRGGFSRRVAFACPGCRDPATFGQDSPDSVLHVWMYVEIVGLIGAVLYIECLGLAGSRRGIWSPWHSFVAFGPSEPSK